MKERYSELYQCRKGEISIRVLFAFLVVIPLMLSAPPTSSASNPFAGKIISIENPSGPPAVNILRVGKNGYVKAKEGDAVFIADTIRTGKGVKVQMELSDESTINIGPNSTFSVKAYMISPDDGMRNYVFKAFKGTIRFMISKAFKTIATGAISAWRESKIVVETPTAIAGVKGTDFFVIVDASKPVPVVDIAVIEGVVAVRNASVSMRDSITLVADQVTTVQRGKKPDTPATLAPDRRNELMQSTTPVQINGPSTTTGSIQAEADKDKKQKKYGNQDIARDIAAGVPLSDVLDRAATAGMSINQMVSAAIDAGVDPYALVYTSITDGYSVENIIEAAITAGASPAQVMSAAIVAGADKTSVISGAATAGAPPESVASAYADATYSYTEPLTTTSTVASIIPPQTIVLTGGGGGIASTQPASVAKPRWRKDIFR